MKVARMRVTPEFLADFLELPNGSHIVGARFHVRDRVVELMVEHPDFDDVTSGVWPTVEPVYTTPSPGQPATFVSWGRR